MRLFAAVLPPPDASAVLAAAVRRLRELPGSDALRWTDQDGWHLTLAFYGETDPALLPDLSARLARVARRRPPFDVALAGGGHFGDRALWAGVHTGRTPLAHLAAGAEAAGRRARVAHRQSRGYHPHLTLARARDGAPPLAAFAAALADLRVPAWRADHLTLVRSLLPTGGVPGEQPRYEPVARWPLGKADRTAD